MNIPGNYLEVNRKLWNAKTKHHLASDFYNLDGFMKGESSLNPIELGLLGDVKGKSLLHLQCHFGQDTLSLARLGAEVTGIDLSDSSIAEAKALAEKLTVRAEFICCDLYDLPRHLDREFDIVFTSYGVLGWLPDMDAWGAVVSKYLKPGGMLVLVEFHPVIWMFDNNFSRIEYPYFNREPIIETLQGTYADREADVKLTEIGWNHPLSDVLSVLLKQGLRITDFKEYDYSPYDCFSNTEKVGEDRYRIKGFGDKLPMVYSVKAEKQER